MLLAAAYGTVCFAYCFFLLKCDVILGPGYKLPKHFFDCSPIDIVEASAILVNVFNRKLLFDLCFLFLSYCSKLINFLCWYLRKELFLRMVTGHFVLSLIVISHITRKVWSLIYWYFTFLLFMVSGCTQKYFGAFTNSLG